MNKKNNDETNKTSQEDGNIDKKTVINKKKSQKIIKGIKDIDYKKTFFVLYIL